MWPLSNHAQLVARGQAYFEKGGAKAVFIGRFLGPVRAIVPLIAGMSNMPPRHFYPVNVLSAIGWAGAHLLPGVLFGASLELAGAMSSRLVALVASVVVGLWLAARVIKLAVGWGLPYVNRLRKRLQAYAAHAHGPLAQPIARLFDPSQHEPIALLVSAVLLVGGAWLFLGVVEDVVTRDTLVDVDRAVYDWLQSVRTPIGDDVMVTITELGGVVVTATVVGVIAAWFATTRRFRTLAYWLAAAIVAEGLVFALKYALGRVRPPNVEDTIAGFSFPSGHAAESLVVYGFLAFLLGHGKPAWQQTTFAMGAAGIALLVALSRLYLGAHWFSDVVASFGLATAWIALLAIAYIQHVREPLLRATPVLMIVLVTLTLVGGSYVANHQDAGLARYAKSTPPPPSLSLDDWRARGYAGLPAARTEIAGVREEPFTLQWAATREALTKTLADAKWAAPASWRSSAALLWLLPSTPIVQLPVVPKFDHGEAPALTFVRALDAQRRLVIRMWDVAELTQPGSASPAPIWVAMITREVSQARWHLFTIARTTSRAVAPEEALTDALRGWQTESRTRAGDADVLLAWKDATPAQ
jgi:membrane-associated phospholipid phosphatase